MSYYDQRLCGCWYTISDERNTQYAYPQWRSLPQVALSAHTTIMSTMSKTILKQTFVNSSKDKAIEQVSYTFPLYDGVSVVGFKCRVAGRTIYGLVKEKEQARKDYKEAVSRGETAGLLEQLPDSSDVFTTKIGNVAANGEVIVEITYLGELKHDAEVDAVRYTIPTTIAPRYGTVSYSEAGLPQDSAKASGTGIEITVDIAVDDGALIRSVSSPSHPIGMTLGRTSDMDEDAVNPHSASATLSLGTAALEKDFVLLVSFKDQDVPRVLLEHHPKYPNQRALMATLVPNFKLPAIRPEIVFVVDRSGSMGGKISTVISALSVFLKSLPVGVKFNICSFGSNHSFLWDRSKSYDETSLIQALEHVKTFDANLGGTEMFQPVKDTIKRRYKDMNLEVMLLTDGQIYNQQQLFDFINESVAEEAARFFSLGIGASASHSLVEGIARAGHGFAQSVGESEKLDKKVIRMLKGALTPHITDFTLEVKYDSKDDFELIEAVTDCLRVIVVDEQKQTDSKTIISLFNLDAKKEPEADNKESQIGKYDHLPSVENPKLLQAPHKIPPLYPFIRTSTYLLMSPDSPCSPKTPKAVLLRATSPSGPLELEIPVQDIGKGQTVHQLAAKKAVGELEEGRGWLVDAKESTGEGKTLKERYDGRWNELVEREAVRLGVRYQVGGKWCSFVAVEKNKAELDDKMTDVDDDEDFEVVEGTLVASHDTPDTSGHPERARQAGASARFLARKTGGGGGKQTDAMRRKPGGAPMSYGPAPAPQPSFRRMAARQTHVDAPAYIRPSGAALFGSQASYRTGSGASRSAYSAQVGKRRSPAVALAAGAPVAAEEMVESSDEDQGFGLFDSDDFDASPPAAKYMRSARKSSSSEDQGFGGLFDDAPDIDPQLSLATPTTQFNALAASMSSDPSSANITNDSNSLKPMKRKSMKGLALCVSSSPEQSKAMALHMVKSFKDDYERMHEIIALQSFEGTWEWSAELFNAVGLKEEDVVRARGDKGKGMDKKMIATVLAVAFLEWKLKVEKEAWELVVEKAMVWLEGSGVGEAAVAEWVDGLGRDCFGS